MKVTSTTRRVLAAAAVVAAAVATQAAAVPASATSSTLTCANVITIVARGSDEAAGTGGTTNVYSSGGLGLMSGVAGKVTGGTSKSVRTVGLKYPATIGFGGLAYFSSLDTGKARLAAELNRLATLCPSSRTVLIGYSQGAHVVGDVTSNSNPNALSTRAKSRIAAVYLTGDPVRRPYESHNRGTGIGGGVLVDRGAGQMSGLGSRILSYCYKGDWACDAPHKDPTRSAAIHTSYGNSTLNTTYGTWIVGKL